MGAVPGEARTVGCEDVYPVGQELSARHHQLVEHVRSVEDTSAAASGMGEIATAADIPLFPKEDSAALSRLLVRLVADKEEVSRIAARGQEIALRDFSFDRMMQRWMTTLQELHERTLGKGAERRAASWSASRPA